MIVASKKGFTLMMAVYFLIFVAGFMALMLSYSSQSLQQTTNTFQREQAQMLARSATEYALLAISAHDRNITSGCVNKIDSNFENIYTITTTIRYFGLGALGANCQNLVNTISTPESNGTVLIDVYVQSNAVDGEIPIRYHKRTLQKP